MVASGSAPIHRSAGTRRAASVASTASPVSRSTSSSRRSVCLPTPPDGRLGRVRDEDLDRLDSLLAQLRTIGQLHERRRGTFTRETAAFLHFHAFTSDLTADR